MKTIAQLITELGITGNETIKQLVSKLNAVTVDELNSIKSISIMPLPSVVTNKADELKTRLLNTVADKDKGAVSIIDKRIAVLYAILNKFSDVVDETVIANINTAILALQTNVENINGSISNITLRLETLGGIVENAATKDYVNAAVGSITKQSLGLGNVDNTSDINKPISMAVQSALDEKLDASEVRNKLDDISTTAPLSAYQGKVLKDLIDGIQAILQSNDTDLDTIQEIVSYVKSNKTLIENITTSKVNVADIVDGLTSAISNKPLSANQGYILKGLIDSLATAKQDKIDSSHKISSDNVDDTGKTNKFITEALLNQITTNQNSINGIKNGQQINNFAAVEQALGNLSGVYEVKLTDFTIVNVDSSTYQVNFSNDIIAAIQGFKQPLYFSSTLMTAILGSSSPSMYFTPNFHSDTVYTYFCGLSSPEFIKLTIEDVSSDNLSYSYTININDQQFSGGSGGSSVYEIKATDVTFLDSNDPSIVSLSTELENVVNEFKTPLYVSAQLASMLSNGAVARPLYYVPTAYNYGNAGQKMYISEQAYHYEGDNITFNVLSFMQVQNNWVLVVAFDENISLNTSSFVIQPNHLNFQQQNATITAMDDTEVLNITLDSIDNNLRDRVYECESCLILSENIGTLLSNVGFTLETPVVLRPIKKHEIDSNNIEFWYAAIDYSDQSAPVLTLPTKNTLVSFKRVYDNGSYEWSVMLAQINLTLVTLESPDMQKALGMIQPRILSIFVASFFGGLVSEENVCVLPDTYVVKLSAKAYKGTFDSLDEKQKFISWFGTFFNVNTMALATIPADWLDVSPFGAIKLNFLMKDNMSISSGSLEEDLWGNIESYNIYQFETSDGKLQFDIEINEEVADDVNYIIKCQYKENNSYTDVETRSGSTYGSGWVSSNTYADYPYECHLNIPKFKKGHFEVTFDMAEALSGNYAPICVHTGAYLIIYSKVNTDITIPLIREVD